MVDLSPNIDFPTKSLSYSPKQWSSVVPQSGASGTGGLWCCRLQHRWNCAWLLSRLPRLSAIDLDVCHKVPAKDADAILLVLSREFSGMIHNY